MDITEDLDALSAEVEALAGVDPADSPQDSSNIAERLARLLEEISARGSA